MSRRTAGAWLCGSIVVALCAPLSPAQFVEEDEKLKDYADRDAAYLERIKAQEERVVSSADPDEARKQFLALANELVRDRNFNVAQDEKFVVRTDDPRLDPKAVLTLVHAFDDEFRRQWAADWPNYAPETEQTPIFMFFSFAKYNQLLNGDFSRSFLRPKGHYADYLGAVVMHSDADAAGDLPDLLVHELAHRLASRQLQVNHSSAPPWVSEGLASYYGFMERDKDGTIRADKIGGKGIGLYRDGRPERPRESLSRLQRARRLLRAAVRKNEPIVELVVRTDSSAAFYAGDVSLNYSIGWLLFHYAMHGESGALREPFRKWLAGDKPSPDAFYEAIGLKPTELEERLAEYSGSL